MTHDQKNGLRETYNSAVGVVDEPIMGDGPCTICDCPGFEGQTPESTICINHNSEGGTCNHYMSEHS
jgi:hypothetical protein